MKFKEKKIRRGVVEKTIVLHKTSLIKQVFKFVNSSQVLQFKIVDDSCRVLKILSESEILEYVSRYGVAIAFEDVLRCVDWVWVFFIINILKTLTYSFRCDKISSVPHGKGFKALYYAPQQWDWREEDKLCSQ